MKHLRETAPPVARFAPGAGGEKNAKMLHMQMHVMSVARLGLHHDVDMIAIA